MQLNVTSKITKSSMILEFEANLGKVALGIQSFPNGVPKVSGNLMLTERGCEWEGVLQFPKELRLEMPAWTAPTNLIDSTLFSFTVARGFGPWLQSAAWWRQMQLGTPPNQVFCWAMKDLQIETYFAASCSNAPQIAEKLSNWVVEHNQQWFGTNELGRFDPAPDKGGIRWGGLPFASPFLRAISTNGAEWVYGGAFDQPAINPMPAEYLRVLNQSNLLYYDWEVTGPRLIQWNYMMQFARMVLGKRQLSDNSAGLKWIQASATRISEGTLTRIEQTADNQLSFTRKSSVPFSALELQLLVDWCESPTFPVGLHTSYRPAQD
jgi:hypothetical protein